MEWQAWEVMGPEVGSGHGEGAVHGPGRVLDQCQQACSRGCYCRAGPVWCPQAARETRASLCQAQHLTPVFEKAGGEGWGGLAAASPVTPAGDCPT